jgi:hypothetical protein
VKGDSVKKPFINQAHPMTPVEVERAFHTTEYPLHLPAILTGGAVPAHVPGAYPNLSCCGGPVALVPLTGAR